MTLRVVVVTPYFRPVVGGVETLVERMSTEARASSSVLIGHHQIAAWVRM